MPFFLQSAVMNSQTFFLPVGNVDQATQLVSINVTVSNGRIRLVVGYANPSLTQSHPISDARSPQGDVIHYTLHLGSSVVPSNSSSSFNNNRRVPRQNAGSIPLAIVASAALPLAVSVTPSLTTPAPDMPPLYTPGTPPPTYSYDIPPSIPPAPSPNHGPNPLPLPIAPITPAPVQLPPPVDPPPNGQAQASRVPRVATRVRYGARPARRSRPLPSPAVAGPGILSVLFDLALEMMPVKVKRRAESQEDDRCVKRRRL
ncbi:hypothetical protein B0H11DRAFT_2189441 [Mycena galericulata]|nr:hypothetical protein B0H11DRAFT_2189441 [Mycena galericulata]